MLDCHIHFARGLGEDRLSGLVKKYCPEGIVLQCIPTAEGRATEQDAFAFRKGSPAPVHIFGGIDRDIYRLDRVDMAKALSGEITRLLNMGCRGIKMLEGKPGVRREYQVPDFDGAVWEPYWAEMEKEQIPLLFHVNDPEEFWDARRVTEAARKYGWFYDQSYIGSEEQYRQVFTVLERHPRLKVIFAHFFFLSGRLQRLSGILERYPNVKIDMTPGIEMYYNLSAKQEKARAFFAAYEDRICYGTDIGARQVISPGEPPLSLEESESRIRLVTRFVEEPGDYMLEPDGFYVTGEKSVPMHGLGLPERAREKLYRDNIMEFLRRG